MANSVGDSAALSRFSVLVAQLESIVASASHKSPDHLLCFDLLSDLLSAIDGEPKESLLLWQRKCEDALYSLLTLGARRPVRHLASIAMARLISKGDSISVYSRVSSLQGFLSDGKRIDPQRLAGATMCLGELYRHFGRRITSGLLETSIIASKLMKFHEEFVRKEALLMLRNALEGCGGGASASAYNEAFRLLSKFAVGDKSYVVRIAAARCLKAFADIGGPGLGASELESMFSCCVKALEDPIAPVRDAFAEALGSLISLAMNPEVQAHPRGKGPAQQARNVEGVLQRHLSLPFMKAIGTHSKEIRVGLTLSWVFYLQATHLKYSRPDEDLQKYSLNVIDMLHMDNSFDAHALACVLYILRVGVIDIMSEPSQRSFLVFLAKQLQSPEANPSMKIAVLRTLSYILRSLGEVPHEFKEVFDDTVVAAVSHSSQLVRIEAALTLRSLAEVDPTCVGGLMTYGVTTLNALRETVSFEKGSISQVDYDSLHGQATVLASLMSVSPKLPLGYPSRLPRSVLEVSKKMLTEVGRNPLAATVKQEAGWLLLSSLLASMPKQELEEQVFDILSLWADLFSRNPELLTQGNGDLTSKICVWSAAVDALTSFVRCFVSTDTANGGILIQPVMMYLSRALSCISLLTAKERPSIKSEMDIFIIRTLIAYQSLPDPMSYKSDHSQIIQLCTTPYRNPAGCEEASCLRHLLDKRDAWLGPWIPGRDWFEDELRAFEGGKDGLLPCVWDTEISSFPLPETINKSLVNQMLLCFGVMFASQDSSGMLSLIGMIDQCLKSGKKQPWRAASISNICVGLLAGLKALLALRRQLLEPVILNSVQTIFKGILAEGDICASQRRACCEGFGLLARLGNDVFTVRITRLLLGELIGLGETSYAGSIALALGCIHQSAGGIALSTLVPVTVSSVSSLAKSGTRGLQIWSFHGLLLTIEAAGLSSVPYVQATLGLALEILFLEENGEINLHQAIGRLINAIVAVVGPELVPGSIFFSRCKSVIDEISSSQETATLLESVRFTQQLVLFAPKAASVHAHVQVILSTLSSRQPTLRHLAVSTLRHLIEKDPVSIIDEQIEDNLFQMLDEETDSEIGNLVRGIIIRLLHISSPIHPSRWISICRNMVLAMSVNNTSENDSVSAQDNDSSSNRGEDVENMVSGHRSPFEAAAKDRNRDKHLRYRTRVFAAECLSYLPETVGKSAAHFDLSLARRKAYNGQGSGDWLVLHIQELISVAYQISTIQFENMRPIGVGLLSFILDKFKSTPDPELPGHLLLEQYQAQFISSIRTAVDTSSGPILLEAGLQLATKIMTSGIISGDQVAVKRIFSLISRPLDDFKDLYYPSFAEWVSSKIKIRLLAAHASLKCYTYAFLRRLQTQVPDECLALLPLFSRSSGILGKLWVQLLKDFNYICLGLNLERNWNSFLDGIESPLVSSRLLHCLEEAWPVVIQALALDSVPANVGGDSLLRATPENTLTNSLISGYSMVELEPEEYRFLWGFSLLVLFQGQHSAPYKKIIPLASEVENQAGATQIDVTSSTVLKLYEVVLPVFQFLSIDKFFADGFLSVDVCEELLQVFQYSIYMDNSWNSLMISIVSQIVHNCPEDFFEAEYFGFHVIEICFACFFKALCSAEIINDEHFWETLISPVFVTAKAIMKRFVVKMHLKSVALAFVLIGYKFSRRASTEASLSKVSDFVQSVNSLTSKLTDDASGILDNSFHLRKVFCPWLDEIVSLTRDCIEGIHVLKTRPNISTLLQLKMAFSLEQVISLAKFAYQSHDLQNDEETAAFCSSVLKHCVMNIQAVLSDSESQVQAIGLQVLKSLQKKSGRAEDSKFVIFIIGEILVEIFTIIEMTFKNPITKETVAVAGECLQILMLLQTIPKLGQSDRSFMKLFLDATLIVFLASEGKNSQEIHNIRSTAVRLVSYLAQNPSYAHYIKEVLLSMPETHRQHIQDVIRASVTQDQTAPPTRMVAPSLEIKLPGPLEGREKDTTKSVTPIESNEGAEVKVLPPLTTSVDFARDEMEEIEDEDEDDDDWDTFQSFPASEGISVNKSKAGDATDEIGLDKNPAPEASNTDLHECSSETPTYAGANMNSLHLRLVEDELPSNAFGVQHQDVKEDVSPELTGTEDTADPIKDLKASTEAQTVEHANQSLHVVSGEQENGDSSEASISLKQVKDIEVSVNAVEDQESPRQEGSTDIHPKLDHHFIEEPSSDRTDDESVVETERSLPSYNMQNIVDNQETTGKSTEENIGHDNEESEVSSGQPGSQNMVDGQDSS